MTQEEATQGTTVSGIPTREPTEASSGKKAFTTPASILVNGTPFELTNAEGEKLIFKGSIDPSSTMEVLEQQFITGSPAQLLLNVPGSAAYCFSAEYSDAQSGFHAVTPSFYASVAATGLTACRIDFAEHAVEATCADFNLIIHTGIHGYESCALSGDGAEELRVIRADGQLLLTGMAGSRTVVFTSDRGWSTEPLTLTLTDECTLDLNALKERGILRLITAGDSADYPVAFPEEASA